jgi:hypothetical protein
VVGEENKSAEELLISVNDGVQSGTQLQTDIEAEADSVMEREKIPESSEHHKTYKERQRERKKVKRQQERFADFNPKVGDVHLLTTTEVADYAIILEDFDLEECNLVEMDLCEELEFEPTVEAFLGETQTGGPTLQDYNYDDGTIDCIVNYGLMNGFLDGILIDSYAALRKQISTDQTKYLPIVRKILDSGANNSMSSDIRRLDAIEAIDVAIRGFNGSRSGATAVGINSDGVRELHVPSMPEDLVLLCMQDYAKKGMVFLHRDGGYVVEMTEWQKEAIMKYLESFPILLKLAVKNKVYEVVDESPDPTTSSQAMAAITEDAFWAGVAYRAGTFFNGRVDFNTVQERILGLLMSGLSFRAIQLAVEHQSLGGVHPSVTKEALAQFERDHGRTPDVVRQALIHQIGNQKAYDKTREPLSRVGQRVEMDAFTWDANDRAPPEKMRQHLSAREREQAAMLDNVDDDTYAERKQVKKLAEHGGGTYGELWVDCYSGKVFGKLRKQKHKPIDSVRELLQTFKTLGVKIEKLAADSGYISDSQYRVFTSEVVKLLLEAEVQMERAEVYNHSIGTQHVENMVKLVKQQMRMAYRYVESNENINNLKFTKLDILRMWGEIFHWACSTINLWPCPNDKTKSREEKFSGSQPNIQSWRLLPIFSTALVYIQPPKRLRTKDETMKSKKAKGEEYTDYYDKARYVYGLYVGFETDVSGSIRIAIPTDRGVRVLSTSKYKAVSEGGQTDLYKNVQSAADRMIEDASIDVPADREGPTSRNDERETATAGEGVESGDIEPEAIESDGNIRDERYKDVVNRNNKMYHDRSEYNPGNFRGRDERARARAARRGLDGLDGLQTIVEEGDDQDRMESLAKMVLGAAESSLYLSNVVRMADISNNNDNMAEIRKNVTLALFSTYEDQVMGNFTDFTNFAQDQLSYYAHYIEGVFVKIHGGDHVCDISTYQDPDSLAEGYRAVTEDVPRNFDAALKSPEWGDAARAEFNSICEKAMVKVPATVAIEAIGRGCDCVTLFPVYEEKIRDGKLVRKVRLVADGRRHMTAGPTYSSTPSKDELYMFLDMIARNDWEWVHTDEDRAFLNADRQDKIPIFARVKGSKDWFQILRALYGLKTSTRDHAVSAAVRLEAMGFKRMGMCTNIFEKIIKHEDGSTHRILVYQYVDDYFFTGSLKVLLEREVVHFKSIIKSSEALWNPDKGLGMEFERDRKRKVIIIRMSKTIQRMGETFITDLYKDKDVEIPLPASKYIVEQTTFDERLARGDEDCAIVDHEGRSKYMSMVGAILWVAGFRWDIQLSTVYLTWFTHEPRLHHLKLGERVIKYLLQTIDVPLVLGGLERPQLHTYSDASLATGPKMKSVIAYGSRMCENSGFISCKVTSTPRMALSSFEGEINGYFESFKSSAREKNIASELGYEIDSVRVIIGDNEKGIQFIKSEAEGKGIRHAEKRFSYMREEMQLGDIDLQWRSGETLVVDSLTKPKDITSFIKFRRDILGHGLLEEGLSEDQKTAI